MSALGRRTPPVYFAAMGFLAAGIGMFLAVWLYQILTGLDVAGINHPVGWGMYITNFVFWIGIAHSGTFISAILHLLRSKWRNAISRSSEAMTIVAILTAGMFPMIHLGRFWVFYYIIPYPSERQIWPDFVSPLVLDLCAVFTYFTVSSIFFYVGLIPDLASARDRFTQTLGPDHWRSKLYRRLSLGWCGAASQWRHYGRGYLYFAALATPLVVSVHSVVSWDFAVSLLPGWHSTIFPPYFVAGAIHSGLAMVLTLVIPMRRLLKLQGLIRPEHLEAVALTMQLTGAVLAYTYIIEPFIAWYGGNRFEEQYSIWKMTGEGAWEFWMLPGLVFFVPLTFLSKRLRRNIKWLFIASILVNVGMWFERMQIITTATWHDFLPHNWGSYTPKWVEICIHFGALSWFLFWVVGFTKTLPAVPTSEYKELLAEEQVKGRETVLPKDRGGHIAMRNAGVLAVYGDAGAMMEGLTAARKAGLKDIETFSPVKVGNVDKAMGLPRGPVGFWTLFGALSGIAGGFWLTAGSASVNNLMVGGKPVVAVVPFLIVMFEGMVLMGAIGNLIGLIVHARMGRMKLPPAYDRRFSRDKFGVFIAAEGTEAAAAKEALMRTRPEELHDVH